ncbi:MAG: Hpt domain-containing protein [Gammaproteobacteria bacterium]|nr:Hpt domain-containing protein [Gammaproteobacteria bacterium]MBU1654870.1 Hpt domain-containing protein [Gammaproteobacteria bacterium]MBU1961161.1 Hpt domain-containing protein [Gammaproteobacteria bacterium]
MNIAKDNFIKWIRKDLFELVREARMALEDFAEGSGDPAQMGRCVERLHQMRGTLLMIQLDGAALLAGEMELLADALHRQTIGRHEEAFEALMLGMVQLPDHIDRVQAGDSDSPLRIVTALNEMRAARDAPLFSELELFGEDLERHLAERTEKGQPNPDLSEVARQRRPMLHQGLLKWFRDFEPAEGVRQILEVTDALAEGAGTERVRLFFRAVGALADAIVAAPLDAGVSVKQLLGKIDREIKRIIDQGEGAFFEEMPLDLYKNVLFHIVKSEDRGERVVELRRAFGFTPFETPDGALPLGGLNAELFDTVAEAVREDLTKIKDELDLFIRTGKGDVRRLERVRDPMAKLAETLGMLGQADLRTQLKEHVERLGGWILGDGAPPEQDLMEMASAILSVESQLQNASFAPTADAGAPVTEGIRKTDKEFNRLLAAALQEASIDMAHIKEAINNYVATGDALALRNISTRFRTVQGALNMLEMEEPARMLANVGAYVEDRLGQGGQPESGELNALADVISSIEYFMESVAGDLGQQEDILAFTRGALHRLEERDATQRPPRGLTGVPESAPLAVPELVRELGVVDEPPSLEGIEIEEAFIDEVAKAEPLRKEYRPEILPEVVASDHDEGPDSEILDIFLEEANEELDVIREQVPRWLNNFEDKEALSRFRRSFHTLKGSGRLVGAELVGEFSWSVETLLNHIIDGTVAVSDPVVSLMRDVLEILPELIESETHKRKPEVDYQSVMERAFALAQGRKPSTEPARKTGKETDELEPEAEGEAVAEPGFDQAAATASEPEFVEIPAEDLTASGLGLDSDLQYEEIEITEPLGDEGLREWQLTSDFALDKFEPERLMDAQEEEIDVLGEPIIELDETLKEIFESESRGHLATLEEFLQECDPTLGCMLTSRVTRALHTLHGSADMAGVTPIARITKANERYFDELMEHHQLLRETDLALLRTTVDMAKQVLAAINVAGADIPGWESHVERIQGQRLQLESLMAVEAEEDSDRTEFTLSDSSGLIHDTEIAPSSPQGDILSFMEAPQIQTSREDALSFMEELPPIEAIEPRPLAGTAAEEYESILVTTPEVPDQPEDESIDDIEEIKGTDQELTEIFLEEAGELLEELESALHSWQANPGDKAANASLQRILHTLKGASRLAGVSQIGDLSHAFESLIIAVERGVLKADASVLSLARRVADQLMAQVDMLGSDGKVPSGRQLVRLLEATQRGELDGQEALGRTRKNTDTQREAEEASIGGRAGPVPMPSAAPPTPEPGLLADESARSLPTALAEPKSETDAEALPDNDMPSLFVREQDSTFVQTPAGRVRQDQIRVRSDQLDRMVNNAGEISIYRTRLEQQNGEMEFNLGELDQTVLRLRQQLRILEIETETQILFRFDKDRDQRGAVQGRTLYGPKEGKASEAEGETFDPLEMDRFSTIQQMSRSLAETVNDLVSIRDMMDDHNREIETLLLQQSRVSNDLQDGLLRTRMVPFNQIIPRLQRLVRQTTQALEKRAELSVEGGGGEVDRTILDRIVAPLEHIFRNAISHGIESTEQRIAAGKPPVGRILLSLNREGRDVVIKVSDDGAGINFQAVRSRALKRGLLTADAAIADEDLVQFVLEPGFSTATTVTQISGRGVGMDVVSSEVKQLGGTLDMSTKPGEGTTFSIRLPYTLALAEALLVNLGEDVFAIPHTSIEGVTRVARQELESCYSGQQEGITYAGNRYRVRYLGEMLEFVPTGGDYLSGQGKWFPLLLVRHGEHRVAVQVDQMVGSRQIVVKSVGMQLSTVRWITGGTILGDGRVALILDVNALVRLADIHQKRLALARAEEPKPSDDTPKKVEPVSAERPVTVMVVDDSITVRKVTGRLLNRHNMTVITAKDGVDALAQLQEMIPDIMLLDIEMPRMDGYELTRHIRHSAELKHIPIIMITSRTGEKHRQRAMDLGVNNYLGKPYQESDLLDSIYALLAEISA